MGSNERRQQSDRLSKYEPYQRRSVYNNNQNNTYHKTPYKGSTGYGNGPLSYGNGSQNHPGYVRPHNPVALGLDNHSVPNSNPPFR